MSEHTVTDVSKRELRVVVTCSCGREFDHPGRDGAEYRHATHVEIETARARLRGEREERAAVNDIGATAGPVAGRWTRPTDLG